MTEQIYDDDFLRQILKRTRIIAMVGASPKPERPSHHVMQFLQQKGYRVIPVNPALAGQRINGEITYPGLVDIPEARAGSIDMVDIFRNAEAAAAPTRDAITIGAKTVWMQLGVVNQEAAEAAKVAGLDVVMDRCPAIEYRRLFER